MRNLLVLCAIALYGMVLVNCSSDKKTSPQGVAPSGVEIAPSGSITAGVGDSIALVVTAAGDPAPTLQWHKNGIPVAAATGTVYLVNPVQFADSGIYTVIATNRSGTATSNSVRIKVLPAGMTIVLGDTAFMVGTNSGDTAQRPPHKVSLSAFYIDSTEVTQQLYKKIMTVNPSYFKGDTLPVENLTWFDAVIFCNARSKREGFDTVYEYSGITGTAGDGCTALAGLNIQYSRRGYRLPTESEWEYSARAGLAGTSPFTATQAWYNGNATFVTHRVATKSPNAFNLFDMGGNVYEWCNDWFGDYSASFATNPTGPSTGTQRIIRGGSWKSNDLSIELKPTYRQTCFPYNKNNDIGFRTVLPLAAQPAVN